MLGWCYECEKTCQLKTPCIADVEQFDNWITFFFKIIIKKSPNYFISLFPFHPLLLLLRPYVFNNCLLITFVLHICINVNSKALNLYNTSFKISSYIFKRWDWCGAMFGYLNRKKKVFRKLHILDNIPYHVCLRLGMTDFTAFLFLSQLQGNVSKCLVFFTFLLKRLICHRELTLNCSATGLTWLPS